MTLEKVSAAKVILTILVNCKNINGRFLEQRLKNPKQLISSTCSLVTEVCEYVIAEKEKAIVTCTDLLSALCSKFEHSPFWREFSPSQNHQNDNPIVAISKALLYFKGSKTYNLIRIALVEVIVNFSRIDEMRFFFSTPLESQDHEKYSLCCIHILLSLSMSCKSEVEKCRILALIALANSMVEGIAANNDKMKTCLCQCGAIPLLLDLSTSIHSSISIKSNASEVMSRCINVSQGMNELIKCHNAVNNLISTFTAVFESDWFESKDSADYRKYHSTYVVNLIQILASIKQVSFDNAYYRVLISLLPSPKRIPGKSMAQSIYLAPEDPVKGSTYEFALSNPSFLVNVSKALIKFLDSNEKDPQFLMHTKDLVERIICILANYSSMHSLFVKNSACILARLVKNDNDIKKYCKELRGMEILTELGNKGSI